MDNSTETRWTCSLEMIIALRVMCPLVLLLLFVAGHFFQELPLFSKSWISCFLKFMSEYCKSKLHNIKTTFLSRKCKILFGSSSTRSFCHFQKKNPLPLHFFFFRSFSFFRLHCSNLTPAKAELFSQTFPLIPMDFRLL